MTSLLEPPLRLDREPPVLWGATAPELYALAGGGLAVWTPLSLALALTLGVGFVGLPAAALLTAFTVRLGAAWLQKAKRGRPEHYFYHWFQLWLMRWGLKRLVWIRYSGPWSLGRKGRGVS